MSNDVAVGKSDYGGLFMVGLATLMYEILLTRIFSVTMWYHFAFVAISLAMFGMTVGALLVYLLPGLFPPERVKRLLAVSALCLSLSIVISFMTHLSIPFFGFGPPGGMTLAWAYSIGLTYAVLSVPFVFSGVCVTLALTKLPGYVSRLYAADLVGAAAGCLFLVWVLALTDGPNAVVVVAFFASLGAGLLAASSGSRRWITVTIGCSLALGAFALLNGVMVARNEPLVRLVWVKGKLEEKALYERWNSFSRVRIVLDPSNWATAGGWGISPAYQPSSQTLNQLSLNIDAAAGTVLTDFHGTWSALEYLKYDVTNIAHYLRHDARVIVIGMGGGRDVLSALVFGQKAVVGVEINDNIIDAVNGPFGDFTGHLDRDSRVTIVNDEARSYIARSSDRFDIIQASLIDTWAATAAGAFVLTENSLYTVEAWRILLTHLTPRGLVTFSRWYTPARPTEMYRLTALASAALQQCGIRNPRNHLVIIRNLRPGAEAGIATLLASREPFSDAELESLGAVAERMRFDLVLTPRSSLDPLLPAITAGGDLPAVTAGYPMNISPPTDDSPFFFNMLRLRDAFRPAQARLTVGESNAVAVRILGVLLVTIMLLTVLCIIIPLLLTTKKSVLQGSLPLFVFFAGIGLAFMFVEISQIQRLTVFLGHPTYGLTVGLFGLLVSSGLGSLSTARMSGTTVKGSALTRFGLLMGLLILFGVVTPRIISGFQTSGTPTRMFVAVAILGPLGFAMGMAFPLGMRVASSLENRLTPWLWGINGAMSVLGSVLAVAVSMNVGISASFWTGFSCYLIAILSFALAERRPGAASAFVNRSVT